ncbi:MAG: nitrogenase iron-molybdenum cofactor biosynthesis protein NifE [Victivallales bacterium]|jgi:nitrogenase molybdenum-cofactor synthesis protein NifE
MIELLKERKNQVGRSGKGTGDIACSKASAAGSVSQRACVFCGSRVVLYPIADAVHLVHGPIGCAAYTWDIRGSVSSGPQLHRNSFSTDLQEQEVIRGGEKKLYSCLIELIERYRPKAAFVYSTCIVGVIGDDVEAVCRKVATETGITVIPVHSEGFKGTKKDGYSAACDALMKLIGSGDVKGLPEFGVNLLGEFNLAGETWIIRNYLDRMGVRVVATITGDGRVDEIRRAHGAKINIVQCSGSMSPLAKKMEAEYGIPFIRVSYFGIEDMSAALYDIADFFGDAAICDRTRELVKDEITRLLPALGEFRKRLVGRSAAVYVGGAFKAFSLVRALRSLGMKTAVVGSQTGNSEDYRQLKEICDDGTIIVDDSNPLELSSFIREKNVDLFIGGVKERPIAYKLGIGFCDHNHERKIPLAGFEGMFHFASEVHATVTSPVWNTIRGKETECVPMPGAKSSEYLESLLKKNPDMIKGWKNPLNDAADGTPESSTEDSKHTSRNSCKLCAPLGASLAFRGVERGMPFLHGSQGCATYIRRYVISHFREPFDIASSSLAEADTIFGGMQNFGRGIDNVRLKYDPALIGVATTCLSETIGENVGMLIKGYLAAHYGETLPALVTVSTPSYKDTHAEGFHAAVRAMVDTLATEPPSMIKGEHLLILPGIVSPADLRHLREMAILCGAKPTLLPDYSETLDAPLSDACSPLSKGGTPIEAIRHASEFAAVIQLGPGAASHKSASDILQERHGSRVFRIGWPLGLRATDEFVKSIESVTGKTAAIELKDERGRLLDAMADGHKYTFGLKAAVYGEEDLVVAICGFLAEIGVRPVLCATGSKSGRFAEWLENAAPGISAETRIIEGADFANIADAARKAKPDIMIGHSKGSSTARELGIPLTRIGFPIHDRFGAPRSLILGYRGAMELFDRIVNAVLEQRQSGSEIGYSYM